MYLISKYNTSFVFWCCTVKAVTWIDEGMVKRIRGVTFSTRVSVQFENTMIHAARGIFNRLLPDVHIFTDHKAGLLAGRYVHLFNVICYYGAFLAYL